VPGSVEKRTVREALTDFSEKLLVACDEMVDPIAAVQCIRAGSWLGTLT
jgi:CRISPR/Cas system type I-B associated protein Csh2 (Cas7 group RAMP superfamily)